MGLNLEHFNTEIDPSFTLFFSHHVISIENVEQPWREEEGTAEGVWDI